MKYVPFMLILAMAACGAETSESAAPQSSGHLAQQPAAERVAAPQPGRTPAPSPSVGALAPDFELPGSDGQTHRLSDYAGQHVVLAFFPKAFTGG